MIPKYRRKIYYQDRKKKKEGEFLWQANEVKLWLFEAAHGLKYQKWGCGFCGWWFDTVGYDTFA